jgi:hypothetical protein
VALFGCLEKLLQHKIELRDPLERDEEPFAEVDSVGVLGLGVAEPQNEDRSGAGLIKRFELADIVAHVMAVPRQKLGLDHPHVSDGR